MVPSTADARFQIVLPLWQVSMTYPDIGDPPSDLGTSHVIDIAPSSTPVTRRFSGTLGTSETSLKKINNLFYMDVCTIFYVCIRITPN